MQVVKKDMQAAAHTVQPMRVGSSAPREAVTAADGDR
jgi:hypothetical protein